MTKRHRKRSLSCLTGKVGKDREGCVRPFGSKQGVCGELCTSIESHIFGATAREDEEYLYRSACVNKVCQRP